MKDRLSHFAGKFINSEEYFRLFFIMSFFFASLCLIRDFFYILAGVLMIWGAWLLGYKMIYKRHILRMRNRRCVYLFLGVSLLSCFLNIGSNFFRNIYIWLFMVFCIIFFYGIHTGKRKNACRREMKKLLELLNLFTLIIMAAGLVLLVIFPSGFEINGDAFVIHENRFVGIIFNANVTAFYALMGIIFSNILIVMKKAVHKLSVPKLIYYIFCITLDTAALFLTDSNGSILMLAVYLCFIAFYALFRGYKPTILNFIFRIIALGLCCTIIGAFLLGGRTLLQHGVTLALRSTEPPAKISQEVATPDGSVTVKPNPQKVPTSFEHQNKNIDSGRYKLWKQSLILFEKFPLFGVGKENIVDYGKIYFGGFKYGDLHNGLLTVLISYGIIGLFSFMVLAVTIGKTMLKAVFRYRSYNRRDGRVLMYITAFCAGYCVYSMFEVALIADLSYRVLIFWLLIGFALSYANTYEHRALRIHKNLPLVSKNIYRLSTYAHHVLDR